jgi:hypothetical protein
VSDTTELEFVNDWSELEQALEVLRTDDPYDMDLGEWDCRSQHISSQLGDAIDTVSRYVHRLLTQYAKLVELSFALTEGWEQYASLNTPKGLYLPDHR